MVNIVGKSAVIFAVLLFNSFLAFSQIDTLPAGKVNRKQLGKEIIVKGVLVDFFNSGYTASAWYKIGRDSIHNELAVSVHGDVYWSKGIPTRTLVGKKITIKGIVKKDKDGIYLDATERLQLQSTNSYAQAPAVVKNEIYLLSCTSFLSNGRPITMLLASKDLRPLMERDSIANEEGLICELLGNSVYVHEMLYSITDAIKWNDLKTKEDQEGWLGSISKKQIKLNRSFSKDILVRFSDNRKLYIQVLKLNGEFWQDKNIHWSDLTNKAGRFEVSKACYAKDYWYQIKDIISTSKLTAKELNAIRR